MKDLNKPFAEAISKYGAAAKKTLHNVAARGEPEEQLRSPLQNLILDLAELLKIQEVVCVGETALADLSTRPDYAVTVQSALVGFIELKAPGKGADPRRFKSHDKAQWEKLQSLPNLLYSDGMSFALFRNGEPEGTVVRVEGEIETSGAALSASTELLGLVENFLRWEPTPPRDAKQLAELSARLCRLLRDEVTEQLTRGSEALTALAQDWRKLLFPEAGNEQFADGYAQAVTFGLLMARARKIKLAPGIDTAAKELGKSNSLIGAALRLLTEDAANQATLKTSLGVLTRVLDVVDWAKISRGQADAWLYFYEDFLDVYDHDLRKLTGSYYTPPEVVGAMVRLVDEVLQSSRFDIAAGLASPAVTVADPAVGTGTFLLGLLRRIAERVQQEEGPGAVAEQINAALARMIGFEMQLGPFAVAQLRLVAELVELTGKAPANPVRMFVTDTLANPNDEKEWIPAVLQPIAESRKRANKIKREEQIMVVIGNPPYKEKAKGRGGWIEGGTPSDPAPLSAWTPPADWGVSAHAKHLKNLYIYFWRWATWKVFDQPKEPQPGVVAFITVAGFLNGPGFQKMRAYLRETCSELWVIDCSPEGHQPDVPTRIFQGVQQPICIVIACRGAKHTGGRLAKVRFQALPEGAREAKFKALEKLRLTGKNWIDCPDDARAPFLPALTGDWAAYPALEDLFLYNGSGVMPGRTWVIAPDKESLIERWKTLTTAEPERKELLFHPHLRGDKPGDKHAHKIVVTPLPGFTSRKVSVADDHSTGETPIRYGFRSFDRWIIPDIRVINQANPQLWEARSEKQVYLTALSRHAPESGPAATITDLIPDMDHYKGSFGGRVFPLWSDAAAKTPNLSPVLLKTLATQYGRAVSATDLFAYLAAVIAHPAYTARFQSDLATPGLRVPLTADGDTFFAAVDLGAEVVWLQTFGERYVDAQRGRERKPPRLPKDEAPIVPKDGAIPQTAEAFPNDLAYDLKLRRLFVGTGFIDRVPPAVWNYEVSGKNVLRQWFSYRKRNRERPIIGDRRPPSPLGEIQPDHWPAEYTTELLNVLNVLGRLVLLEPQQASLLERICGGPTITADALRAAGAFEKPARKQGGKSPGFVQPPTMFGEDGDD